MNTLQSSLTEAVTSARDKTLSFSVIICAYTEDRWNDLVELIASMGVQSIPPQEVIVVIDHNPNLFGRARQQFPGVVVTENFQEKGLSGARNSGMAIARGSLIAFMDEDAVAEPDWLERLLEEYADPQVMGVGGSIEPMWLEKQPRWFPEEFHWVIGCTYKGMPEHPAAVRNMIGANMSFRAEVLQKTAGFRTSLGRVNTLPLGCEETELCIRTQKRFRGKKFQFTPAARVYHRVPARRGTFAYFASRCYSEGISKVAVSHWVGAGEGLSSERNYLLHTLPGGVLRGMLDGLHGDWSGLSRAASILAGLGITGLGYLAGAISSAASRLAPKQTVGREALRSNPDAIPVTGKAVRKQALHRQNAHGQNARGQNARPRILMVTPRFFPHVGGVESHVYEVARRLAAQSVDITVLTTDPSGDLPESEVMDGFRVVRTHAWPKNGDLFIAPGIYRAIRQGNWDLIHIQSYHTFVPPLAMLAAVQSQSRYVVTFHGGGHSSRVRNSIRGIQRALLKPLFRRADRLVAVANFEITQYGRELDIPASGFALIPNGSDLPMVTSAATERSGSLIVSVGRLERYKGHHRLIQAMPFILEKMPEARLWIAGTGSYEAELRRLIEKLDLRDVVEIRAVPMSDREALAAELSRASLFVLLSEFETHPIAVIEALSVGLPALVADTSGLRELAEKGFAKSIPLSSTNREIALAVLEQLKNPQYPPKMSAATWDQCAHDLLHLYETVIATAKGDRFEHSHADAVLPSDLRRD